MALHLVPDRHAPTMLSAGPFGFALLVSAALATATPTARNTIKNKVYTHHLAPNNKGWRSASAASGNFTVLAVNISGLDTAMHKAMFETFVGVVNRQLPNASAVMLVATDTDSYHLARLESSGAVVTRVDEGAP